jgi:hypothetical protein
MNKQQFFQWIADRLVEKARQAGHDVPPEATTASILGMGEDAFDESPTAFDDFPEGVTVTAVLMDHWNEGDGFSLPIPTVIAPWWFFETEAEAEEVVVLYICSDALLYGATPEEMLTATNGDHSGWEFCDLSAKMIADLRRHVAEMKRVTAEIEIALEGSGI